MSEVDWDALRRAAEEGRATEVKLLLTPTHRVEPQRRPGRPRTRGALKYSHYEGSTTGHRPKCRVRGCQNFLRRGQYVACSLECLEKLKEQVDFLTRGMSHDAAHYVEQGDVGPSHALFEVAGEGEPGGGELPACAGEDGLGLPTRTS